MAGSEKHMKLLAKGAIILLIGAFVGKAFSFVYRVILAHLGEQAYGEFSLALALFGILSVIAVLGFDTGLMKFISTYNTQKETKKIKGSLFYSSKIVIATTIILGIILFLSAHFIANYIFHAPNITLLIQILALALPFEGLRAILGYSFRAFHKVEYDVLSRIILETVLKVCLTLFFVWLGLGVAGAAIAYALSIFISFIAMLFTFKKKTFNLFDKTTEADYEDTKRLLIYSLPLVFNNLAIMFLAWVDSLMIGYYLTTADVGVYNVALPTAKLILLIPSSITGIYLALIASVKDDKDAFHDVYVRTTKWNLILTGLAYVWMMLYAHELITLFFPAGYLAAALPLMILITGFLINGISYTSRDALLLYDKTKLVFIVTLLGGAINVLINFLLVPRVILFYGINIGGINGAAIGNTLAFIILSSIYIIASRKDTKKLPFTFGTLVSIISLLVAGALTHFIVPWITTAIIPTIILSIISISLITFILLLLTKQIDKEDWNLIRSIINKAKSYASF